MSLNAAELLQKTDCSHKELIAADTLGFFSVSCIKNFRSLS